MAASRGRLTFFPLGGIANPSQLLFAGDLQRGHVIGESSFSYRSNDLFERAKGDVYCRADCLDCF